MVVTTLIGGGIGLVVGILGAVAVSVAFGAGAGVGFGALAGLVVLSIVAYLVANASNVNGSAGQLMRGLLIGTNAGLNAAFLSLLFGTPVGLVLGLVVGAVIVPAVFEPIAGSDVYQGFLGWLNWAMPMSWLVVGLGLLFFAVNLAGHLFAYLIGRSEFWRVREFKVDWKTGSFFTKGGIVSNLNMWDTAFNMGNFAFVDMNNPGWDVEHEAGHTLNLAAFGSAFHFIGFFDEFVFGNGGSAYAERIADSNDPATTNPQVINLWV